MLKMGSSVEWPDALEAITGARTMSAGAIIEYFQPLIDYLTEYNDNSGERDLGEWTDECPTEFYTVSHGRLRACLMLATLRRFCK